MFFAPIIRLLSLAKLNNKIHVLCMTSGTYYGLGEKRKLELHKSCRNLVNESSSIHVNIVDNEDQMPDNPVKPWNKNTCIETIERYVKEKKID